MRTCASPIRRYGAQRFLLLLALGVCEGALLAGCSWARTKSAPPAQATPPPAQTLTLVVHEPAGVPRTQWPLSVGVPFAPGALRNAAGLSISDAKAVTPLQTRVLSRWNDGSVRWILLDWQADLTAHQGRRFDVGLEKATASTSSVKVTDAGDRVDVDTGPLQFTIPKNRFAVLSAVRLHGSAVGTGPVVSFFNINGKRVEAQPPRAVTITEFGPLRVRIELRGEYSPDFAYIVRVDAFANQPFVRVLHTFEQHADAYTSVKQIGIDVPMKLNDKIAYSAGREDGKPFAGALPGNRFALLQEDSEFLRIGGARQPGRAAGWIDLHDATHGVAVATRFFWQQYPQSFQLRPNGLTYNMWAPEAAPAKIGMGAAKTHEMYLYFHDHKAPTAGLLTALAQPLLAQMEPQWVVASGALRNSVAPGAGTTGFLRELAAAYRRYQAHAETERWDDSGQVHCPPIDRERPRRGFFGMLNWGDWNFPGYHDTTKGCDAWGNLEYDTAQVLALAYTATGDRPYYDGMVAAARHFMDVDTIHYQRQHPTWTGMNHPKNPLHFSFDLGGVDLGHTWTEGLLSYYYLTGDERGLDAARGIADYLAQRLRSPMLIGNPRQFGWPQIALVAAYDATGNEAYRTAAAEYARRAIATHPPTKMTDWKLGILAEALSYTHSVTGDSAIRDWLARYAAAVRARPGDVDPRFLPAVTYVGRLSGQDDYKRNANAVVARLRFGTWGKPFTIAGRLGFSMLSSAAASGSPTPVMEPASRSRAPAE